ncbi:hypothetical protein CMO91_05305 [Candidatus Woesearchaeota archaeon]|nr:hypothetical protein [Candidatus Woesearchaeota archaeon]|tara:strand:+ start:275 stop:538 length:264 start_codon:yes stop_codon:yes gene_type:complete
MDEEIKATILYHLRRKKILGGVHTHFDTIKKGFPGHLGKDTTKMAKELIKKGWLLTKSTSYGLQISLNKAKLSEIDVFIEKVLDFKF